MTEKEILQHAKGYIDNLANGINPLTGEPVDENDVVNQVRISRCLFYVSGVLEKVLNGQKVFGRGSKRPFSVTPEQLECFPYSDEPIYVSVLAELISALSADGDMKKLSAVRITKWLLGNGFLEEVYDLTGKTSRRVTALGKSIGIYQEERDSMHGKYLATLYTTDAQHFVVDHIEAILADPS